MSKQEDLSQGIEYYYILSIIIATIRLIIPLIVIGGAWYANCTITKLITFLYVLNQGRVLWKAS